MPDEQFQWPEWPAGYPPQNYNSNYQRVEQSSIPTFRSTSYYGTTPTSQTHLNNSDNDYYPDLIHVERYVRPEDVMQYSPYRFPTSNFRSQSFTSPTDHQQSPKPPNQPQILNTPVSTSVQQTNSLTTLNSTHDDKRRRIEAPVEPPVEPQATPQPGPQSKPRTAQKANYQPAYSTSPHLHQTTHKPTQLSTSQRVYTSTPPPAPQSTSQVRNDTSYQAPSSAHSIHHVTNQPPPHIANRVLPPVQSTPQSTQPGAYQPAYSTAHSLQQTTDNSTNHSTNQDVQAPTPAQQHRNQFEAMKLPQSTFKHVSFQPPKYNAKHQTPPPPAHESPKPAPRSTTQIINNSTSKAPPQTTQVKEQQSTFPAVGGLLPQSVHRLTPQSVQRLSPQVPQPGLGAETTEIQGRQQAAQRLGSDNSPQTVHLSAQYRSDQSTKKPSFQPAKQPRRQATPKSSPRATQQSTQQAQKPETQPPQLPPDRDTQKSTFQSTQKSLHAPQKSTFQPVQQPPQTASQPIQQPTRHDAPNSVFKLPQKPTNETQRPTPQPLEHQAFQRTVLQSTQQPTQQPSRKGIQGTSPQPLQPPMHKPAPQTVQPPAQSLEPQYNSLYQPSPYQTEGPTEKPGLHSAQKISPQIGSQPVPHTAQYPRLLSSSGSGSGSGSGSYLPAPPPQQAAYKAPAPARKRGRPPLNAQAQRSLPSHENLAAYSFQPKDTSDKSFLKGRADIVESLKEEDTVERVTYDPKSIARDVLIACGRHPTEPALNHHLFRLRDVFSYVDVSSDLTTFRWDLVDPKQSRDTQRNEQKAEPKEPPQQASLIKAVSQPVVPQPIVPQAVPQVAVQVQPPVFPFNTHRPQNFQERQRPQQEAQSPFPPAKQLPEPELQVVLPETPKKMPGRPGRPPGSSKPKVVVPPPPDVSYAVFSCKWGNCQAELHNLDMLRKHIFKNHVSYSITCSWKGCQFTGTLPAVELFKHVKKEHLEPIAWKQGDGPSVPTTDSCERATALTIPETGQPGAGDSLIFPANYSSVRAFNRVHGNHTQYEKAQEILKAVQRLKGSIGVGLDPSGCELATRSRNERVGNDEEFYEIRKEH